DDRSELGCQRDLRDRARRAQERLRDPRRRIAEELLPAGAADALGGLRHPEGRQRFLHPDRGGPGRLGRVVGRDAGRGRELGEGEPRRAARHRRRLLRFDDRVSAVLRVRRRIAERPAAAQGAAASPRAAGGGARARGSREVKSQNLTSMGTLPEELAPHAERIVARPRIYADANVPAGLVAHMRTRLRWDVLFVVEEDDLRRASDARHYQLAQQLRRTLVTMDRDYLD